LALKPPRGLKAKRVPSIIFAAASIVFRRAKLDADYPARGVNFARRNTLKRERVTRDGHDSRVFDAGSETTGVKGAARTYSSLD